MLSECAHALSIGNEVELWPCGQPSDLESVRHSAARCSTTISTHFLAGYDPAIYAATQGGRRTWLRCCRMYSTMMGVEDKSAQF
jgi:hypothetical protein